MKYVTRAVIFTVSILTSYLITYSIEVRILEETEQFRPIVATAVGMATIVLIFVPIFAYTERITEAVVKSSLQQTKQGAGKVLGVIIFTIIVLIILFALYLDKWFEMSIIDAI